MSPCKKKVFWLTNTSNRNVSLADLNLTVKAYSSVNLLDKRHYSYTIEQLESSALNGSIYKKSHLLSVRKVPPEILKKNGPMIADASLTSRQRSIVSTKEEHHDELSLSDEQFASDSADLLK